MNLGPIKRFLDSISYPHPDDRHRRQSLALSVLLLLSLTMTLLLVITHVLGIVELESKIEGLFLSQEGLVIILILGLVYLNRRGHISLAAHIYLLLCLISIPFTVAGDWAPYALLLYAIPVQAASFILNPKASFPIALLSIISYAAAAQFFTRPFSNSDYLFIGVLIFEAMVSWFTSGQLEQGLTEAKEIEQKFLSLLEKNPSCIYLVEGSQAGRWIYASPRISDLLGFDAKEWLDGTNLWLRHIHADDRQRVLEELSNSLAFNLPFHGEYRMVHRSGKIVWVNDDAVPVYSAATPRQVQGILFDVTARKRAAQVQAAIYRISQAAYSAVEMGELYATIHHVLGELMPAENFFIALYDSATDTLSFPYFVDQYDEPPEPIKARHGLTEYVLRTGEALFASPEKFSELVALGEVAEVGAPSVDWLGVPLIVNGRSIGVMAVQSYTRGIRFTQEELDIMRFVSTQVAMVIERKLAEEAIRTALTEKEVLLREIHHRVKNNLQVMSSLLSLQADTMDQPAVQEQFQEMQARVRSMALIHEELYQSDDLARVNFAQYIEKLADSLQQTYLINPSVQLRLEVEEVYLNVDTAIPCGLVINELVTNAFKYAFPKGQPGEVAIHLYKGSGDRYHLMVEDNGIGLPESLNIQDTETLGMQLVSILARQLRGTFKVERNHGTRFEIEFQEHRSGSRVNSEPKVR